MHLQIRMEPHGSNYRKPRVHRSGLLHCIAGRFFGPEAKTRATLLCRERCRFHLVPCLSVCHAWIPSVQGSHRRFCHQKTRTAESTSSWLSRSASSARMNSSCQKACRQRCLTCAILVRLDGEKRAKEKRPAMMMTSR